MPPEPRRHHYLPQFYLAGFTISGEKDGDLYVINRDDGRQWKGTPNSVGHQRDFYRVDDVPGMEPFALEKDFSEFEGKVAHVLEQIFVDKRLPDGGEEANLLINFVAIMTARVPRTRNVFSEPLKAIAKRFIEMRMATPERFKRGIEAMRAKGLEVPDESEYEALREFVQGGKYEVEINPAFHIWQLIEVQKTLVPLLGNRRWTLYVCGDGDPEFIVSDCPVALTWSDPNTPPGFFGPGFGLPGTDVTVPLGRGFALLGRFEGEHGNVGVPAPAWVAGLNSRTGLYAERFVCSGREDFTWLRSDGQICPATALMDQFKKRSVEQSG
jgi:hypothetical protein